MKNQALAKLFREIATMLTLKGDNPFKIRAYERAAQTLESLQEPVEDLAAADTLTDLAGIGKDLSEKIKEYVASGRLKYYQELKAATPAGLTVMLQIPGLGPKTVKQLYDQLGIDTIDKLEEYAQTGRLKGLEGIKAKTEENILRGISLFKQTAESIELYIASDIAEKIISCLAKVEAIQQIALAGSLRRQKAAVKDIDIVASSRRPDLAMDAFIQMPFVKEVIAHGLTKSSIIADQAAMQVDLRVVDDRSFAAALLYFTGSKEFNVRFRALANKKKYKINEYGVFVQEESKGKIPSFSSEADIFSFMGMSYIEPELREDRGEIDAALNNKLPRLIEKKDIKGDLHVHTNYSDGIHTLKEMALAAESLGYAYVGLADHSQSLRVAGGLSPEALRRKIEEVKEINRLSAGMRILSSAEVDILSDGKLDYPDSILEELDYVIAAIHSSFKQSASQITRRLVAVCQNKYVNIIAHPTGVLRGAREAYDIDFDEFFKAAADNNVALEINSHPQRLDLNDHNAFKAKRYGVKLCINTDAHDTEHLKLIDQGLAIARRAWLEPIDVVNCLDLKDFLKWAAK